MVATTSIAELEQSRAELDRKGATLQRMLRLAKARDSLLDFTQMVMPDPADPDNHDATLYEIQPVHRLLAEILEKVERGELTRVAISMPPRHGKSEICTRKFPAWFMGRDPYRQVILAGASGEFADSEFGRKIKGTIQSPGFKQVFPRASLDGGSKAVGNLVFKEGGAIKSIGKGAQLVGRGADLFIIDDPYANAEEAMSDSERKKLWEWFTSSAMTRLMPGGRMVIIHQRWHEDDLIGRLCDPQHPEHDENNGKRWTYINIPAIVKEEKLAKALNLELEVPVDEEVIEVFGNKPMAALWPNRYSLKFFEEVHRNNPKVFRALYDGNPTPEEGDFFSKDWLQEYKPKDLPKNLRYYCASDHAVSTAQYADKTCLLPAGIDEEGNIWVLPEVWWERKETDDTVDAMLQLMRQYVPMTWWAEKGHISKSIGPFLRKRMEEEKVFVNIQEMTPTKDKQTRAQSIQGRMSMRKVFFPGFAPWWQDAKKEILRFPNATHDDFVDALSWLGIGLGNQIRPSTRRLPKSDCPRTGSPKWVRWASDRERFARKLAMKDGF